MYLQHRSRLGEFFLSSDSVMQTFTRWPALKPITEQLPEPENEAFATVAYTIGGMMVFPGNQIDRKPTLNQARGLNRSIADRFDLTLECIRRHYRGEWSPLASTLSRYDDFFALFDDFRRPAVPRDVDTYKEYRHRSIEFIDARNQLIEQLNV